MKIEKDWSFRAPWGKIALVSWGNPAGPPVLLLHGYMDTAATFIPFVNILPDDYYYVGVDIPGHGKSDPFPPGMPVSQLHIVEAIKLVVEHMRWRTFVFIAHSMGCLIGLFYNHVYPGKMNAIVLLDSGPPISMFYFVEKRFHHWFTFFYNEYYDNFEKIMSGEPKVYSYKQAISLLVRNRSLSEEQAEIVLSRSLVRMGTDNYKFSWDPRMKKAQTNAISEEIIYTVLKSRTPTLCLDSSESKSNSSQKQFAENLMNKAEETLPHFRRITINGGHDVHITNPELLRDHVVEFMNKYSKTRNKLCRL